jgi:uncharacterized protein YecA (UPF0149 family)
MPITLELDSTLQVQAEMVAQAAGLSVSEWIMNLLRNQIPQESPRDLTTFQDPLIEGLFDGATDLAETSEDLLQREMTSYSGWTWKTDKL